MNQEPGLDRSTVIGIVLITMIMGVWLVYFSPQPPAEPPQDAPVATESLEAEEPAVIGPQQAQRFPLDSSFAAASQGSEELVTVSNGLYRAQFSTKGATLQSYKLVDYDVAGEQNEPVEMVSSENGALALAFTPPQGQYVDTRSLYYETPGFEGDSLVVSEEPRELVFEVAVPGGTLRQVYTFTPDSYEVGMRVEEVGTDILTSSGGYEVVWDGGIPFAEAGGSQEAAASGAYARSGGEVEAIDLMKDASGSQRLNGNVDWVAVKDKYFIAVILPDEATEGAEIEGERFGEVGDAEFAEDFAIRLLMPPPRGEADTYRFYIGPMEFDRIGAYDAGLYDVVDYGFGSFITRPIAQYIISPSFRFLGSILPNYGLVIILFAFAVKMLLYPLTKVSYKNTARMRELQPKMDVIKEKYADDPQKQQEAMMKMYRETGVNPLAGCLPLLLQYPIIIALWRYFQNSIVIRQEQFLWAHDLSAPDPILNLPFEIPFYGNFVAGFTLIMGLAMIVQMKVAMPASTSGAQAKIMMYFLPGILFVVFNRLASGLSLYYLTFNVLSIVQQRMINKSVESGEDNVEADKGKGKTGRNGRARQNGQASGKRSRRPKGTKP
ncbi:MAG: membrane protein insertase YidC [Rhodothermales bacterium]